MGRMENRAGNNDATKESVDKLIPDYYEKYNPYTRQNAAGYLDTLSDRFQQRVIS